MPLPPFEQRLAEALSRITTGTWDVPDHQAAQIGAATRVTRDAAAGIAASAAGMGRDLMVQFDHRAGPQDREYVARLLVALEAAPHECPHARQGVLNRASPLPVIARLSLGRIDCHPCVRETSALTVPDVAGPCDFCGAFTLHGRFGEIVCSIGHLLVAGAGCPACSDWFRAHIAATGG